MFNPNYLFGGFFAGLLGASFIGASFTDYSLPVSLVVLVAAVGYNIYARLRNLNKV